MEPGPKPACQPRVQVILPAYNAARWFEPALRSVAHEDGVEVLVIDDGSDVAEREAVSAICARFPNVRFHPRPHAGIVGALNYGLSIVTSEYVGRMDADDISLPGRFAAQVEFLDRNPDIAVVGTQIQLMDQEGVNKLRSPVFPGDHRTLADELYKGRCLIQHPSVLMRREAVLDAGGYDPMVEYAEDYDLWVRLSRRWRIANLETVYLMHRRHDLQITNPDNVKQKKARDVALVRARLTQKRGVAPRDEDMQTIKENVAGYFAVAERISRGHLLTWPDVSLLISCYSCNLLGEGRGYKKRLIKKVRDRRLLGGWASTYLACCLLWCALKLSSTRWIGEGMASRRARPA